MFATIKSNLTDPSVKQLRDRLVSRQYLFTFLIMVDQHFGLKCLTCYQKKMGENISN